MTLHVVYDHQCPKCEAHYIPFDYDISCPNCGHLETERFDYIPEAINSMMFNKMKWGTYTPGAWWIGSLGDHILDILFAIFDDYSGRWMKTDFQQYCMKTLEKMEWGDQKYLKKHIHQIALRVYDSLEH